MIRVIAHNFFHYWKGATIDTHLIVAPFVLFEPTGGDTIPEILNCPRNSFMALHLLSVYLLNNIKRPRDSLLRIPPAYTMSLIYGKCKFQGIKNFVETLHCFLHQCHQTSGNPQ